MSANWLTRNKKSGIISLSTISYQLRQGFLFPAAQLNNLLSVGEKAHAGWHFSMRPLADKEMVDPSGVGFFVSGRSKL